MTIVGNVGVQVGHRPGIRPSGWTDKESSAHATARRQAERFTACTVPDGYVYTNVNLSYSCSWDGIFPGPEYTVEEPRDDMRACNLPSGYTYTQIGLASSCVTSGTGAIVRLRVPQDGMWACAVPSGFRYTQVRNSSACAITGTANQYRLTPRN